MLPDHRVLYHHGGCDVLRQQHHVGWTDGSALALHPVRLNGVDDTYRRALVLDDDSVVVFDVRRLCRSLRAELAMLMPRDHQGCVMHRLRLDFHGAGAVIEAAVALADLAWYPDAPPSAEWRQAPLEAA